MKKNSTQRGRDFIKREKAKGRIRRSYQATKAHHGKIKKRLDELQGKDND